MLARSYGASMRREGKSRTRAVNEFFFSPYIYSERYLTISNLRNEYLKDTAPNRATMEDVRKHTSRPCGSCERWMVRLWGSSLQPRSTEHQANEPEPAEDPNPRYYLAKNGRKQLRP